jgi:hypothetical protein
MEKRHDWLQAGDHGKITIYFQAAGGYEAAITGDEAAIRALEELFERSSVRYEPVTQMWTERGVAWAAVAEQVAAQCRKDYPPPDYLTQLGCRKMHMCSKGAD